MSENQKLTVKARSWSTGWLFNKKAFVLLVTMTLMVSMGFESVNYIPLKSDGIDMENDMPNRGTHHYKIKVGNDFQSGQDLVITAKAVGARSDPDLYISSSEDPAPSRQNNEYACAMVGDDVCTIPSKEIYQDKTFYVTVSCFKKCEYAIKAELLKEIPIKAKRDYSIITNSAAQRIFVFNNTHKGVKDILISVRSDSTTSSMRMYVKEGADGAPTSNDMKSTDAWENGIILKFNNNSMVKIGEGQTYKILFETDEAINANLRIDMVYRDLIITEGKAYDDFLLSRDKSCYKYRIESADKIFRVGVYSFSGNPDIYVTSETENIDNLDRYEYKATEPTDDVLVITPEDRKKNGVVKGWYHICVLAKSTTSYRLRVAESNENYFLEDGIAETNEIKSGQDLTLYYTDGALARDLNLTFTLSPHSGPAPKMYIKFCGSVNEEHCKIGNKHDSNVIKAVREHGEMYAFIKHHGRECATKETIKTKPCLYAVQVSLPETGYERVSHFSVVAHHNETSHIHLREGVSMENVLESNQYKFFKFVNRDSDATNVTFTVRSHHGDADIFVSKTEKYPNEEHFDRKSDLSSRFADEVVFSKNKKMKSIEGTYYIGVKGVEYTSYSIIASITRKGDKGDDEDDVVGPREIVPFQLREGVTHNEFLSEKTKKYYKFKTTMRGEDIHDIRITLTSSSGKYQYFVRSGKIPTKNNYDYASFDGSDIIMKKDDKKFKAIGTKYIMVMPNTKLEKFPERGRFALKYTAGHTLQPINKGIPVEGTVKLGDYDYFRYHSLDKDRDLVVSLTPHSGESNLVVSTDPENMYPTVKNNSFHSLKEGRDSIILKGRDLFKGIKTCNPIEAMKLGESPCEVFIGVHCDDSTRSGDKRKNDRCSFSLKIYSMRNTVHLLHSGVPQKDHVQKKQSMTYYMPLDAKKDDLYITANAEQGGVKIYASFGDHKLKYSEIDAPTKEEHAETGREVGNSQMIHFKRDDIRKNCTEFIECMVIISVEGIGEGQDSGKDAAEKEKANEFVITAYYHIRKLIPNAASFTEMEADTMTYFTYRSFCDECTIFLSAIPFSIEADIDMYLNIGAQKDLPTNQSYDIMRDEWFTEHIELDTNHEFYKAANIKNMQDTIIIGIYARQNTLVDIYVEESKGKIQTLTLGKGIQMSQKEETRLFRYAHKGDSSIKFELVGLHGVLKIKANCYDPIRLEKSMNSYLPSDDNTPSWQMNTEEGVHTLIIESTHEDFCPDGVYLLSVTAVGWKGSKYTLRVHTDKTFTFNQMKVGVPVKDMLSADQEKKYSFVLDKKKPFRIVSSVSSGGINFELSKTKDFKKVTHSSGTNDYIRVDEYDVKKDFKSGENLYIRVTGEKDYTEFVLVVTHDDSYSIIPDGQVMTYTVDPTSAKGINLMYYPPASAISMKIQVDGYDAGVAFVVNHKDEYLYQIKNGQVQFPAFNNEETTSTEYATEGKRYINIIPHESTRDDPFVWLINIAPVIYDDDAIFKDRPKAKNKDEVQISVQISVSEVNILAQNKVTEHIYRTHNVGEYTYFKFFASGNKDIEVALTPCVCMTEMSIFKSMSDAQQDLNPQYRSFALENGLKKIHIPDASGPYFIKVSKSLDPDFDKYRYDTVPCTFEIVYYEKKSPNYEFMTGNMYPEDDGAIQYWWRNGRLKLLWGSIIKEDEDKVERSEAIGELYGFKEKHILMTSVCGFKKHLETFETPIYKDLNVKRNNQKPENYSVGFYNLPNINREEYMTFYFLAHVNRKGGAILYKPLTVKVDGEWNSGIPWFLIFVVILVLASLGYAAYYYKNMQKDDKRPRSGDYEMNDMREFSRVPAQDQYGL